jgi:tRNA A-37 threonylcarbamoyl transferase component Bud32/DNA-binding beta-propeller fold protein YncE
LLKEIARGGMGVVYKARQVRLNRIVALKMILAGQFASQAEVQRFHTEAESAAALDHPGIVPIFEVGEYGGHHFFSMGFVDGDSLAKRIADAPLAPRDAAALVQRISDAIQFAHDHGVIHRDLKPANVLLDKDGQPRVTDFGLAKKVKSDSNLTGTGQVLGTPSYMSPEQAAGRVSAIRETADVYSLGAILYAALTGRPPFQADNPLDTLMQALERDPVSPRQLNPSVPRDLETICLKCLEKDRRRRYASARALADDLGRFLDGRTILARPAGTLERITKWSRRRPASAALIGVSVLATVLLAAGGAYFVERLAKERNDAIDARNDAVKAQNNESIQRGKAERAAKDEATARAVAVSEKRQADDARTAAVSEKQKADTARTLAEQQRDRAEWLAYAAQLGKVQREWIGDKSSVNAVRDLLSACQWNRRGWEHDYWHTLLYHRGHRTVARPGVSVHGIAISPDGKHLATVGNSDQRIKVWDIESGSWLFEVPLGKVGVISSVAFSPDGTLLASPTDDNSVGVWSAATGNEIRRLSGHSFRVARVAISSDSQRLAAFVTKRIRGKDNVEPGHLVLWNLETGERLTTIKEVSESSFAWHPDGTRIATTDGKGVLKLFDVTDGRELVSIVSSWRPGSFLRWR